MPKQKTLLQWSALKSGQENFQSKWLLVLSGVASIAMIVRGILTKDAIVAITFGVLALVCFMFVFEKPRKIKAAITEEGIIIDDRFYCFDELESFWIVKEGEVMTLQLKTTKIILPFIFVPLENQNPEKVREILLNYLEEKKEKESFIDI